jgi:hypothetical protein
MKYFGTITGLSGAETPGALLPAAEERPGPNYLGLGLLCLAGLVVVAALAYMFGRRR